MEEIEYDLEEYEKQYERIRKDNEELLAVFREDLSNLKPATIRRHLSNVDFYINEYLLYEEPLSFDEGIYRIDDSWLVLYPQMHVVYTCVNQKYSCKY